MIHSKRKGLKMRGYFVDLLLSIKFALQHLYKNQTKHLFNEMNINSIPEIITRFSLDSVKVLNFTSRSFPFSKRKYKSNIIEH